ncbi:Non-specific serine/threonine protein kinase [Bertholletia excelsa]
MEVAKSNVNKEFLLQQCRSYKVASLYRTILEADQTSNLRDRYVLGEQLGWGQFGIIRACSDKFTGEVLACKSIAKDRLVTQDDVRGIKLEIEIMASLSGHPNIVDLKAVYEDEDYVHLVMELCAGGELFHRLEKQGRFSEFEARILFRQLMQVVTYCHKKGVVHRDLKPENILLTTKASSSPIKLADFGLATYIKSGQSLHGTVGSPFYIAPEVLEGGYNEAADVWSAGVILYILLSGVPPFWGRTKSQIFGAVRAADLQFPADPWDHISDSAKELVRKMLCTDPCIRLTALQVLGHAWISNPAHLSEDSTEGENHSQVKLDMERGSFSASFMSRKEDISFGTGSPIINDSQSPSLTCRASFSSFLIDPTTPCSALGGFSICCSDGSNAHEFTTPVTSMPSFSFFASGSIAEQGNCEFNFSANIPKADSVQPVVSLGKLFTSSDSSLCIGFGTTETERKASEVRRAEGMSSSRMSGIHSKRNRTIGLGEFDQLDLVVTESVIRWASCTNLPTATSLRSSLVC